MNIMWTPNKKLGLSGKTNSGVVGVTHLSMFMDIDCSRN